MLCILPSSFAVVVVPNLFFLTTTGDSSHGSTFSDSYVYIVRKYALVCVMFIAAAERIPQEASTAH